MPGNLISDLKRWMSSDSREENEYNEVRYCIIKHIRLYGLSSKMQMFFIKIILIDIFHKKVLLGLAMVASYSDRTVVKSLIDGISKILQILV